MADVKTKPTKQSPSAFLRTVEPKQKSEDSLALLEMFQAATGQKAIMWGTSIVGFGVYKVKCGNRENDWPLVAFSPRKQSLTLYVAAGRPEHAALLQKLGKYKVSGSCLHIKKLSDVDRTVLAVLIKKAFRLSEKECG